MLSVQCMKSPGGKCSVHIKNLSTVQCFPTCIACWSRLYDRLFGDGHSTPLVGDSDCVNLLVKKSCQGKSTDKGKSGS